jgi:hypothetical protein
MQDYRDSRLKTIVSLKFLILLTFLPLITQILFKNFIVSPFIDHYRDTNPDKIALNIEFERQAIEDLGFYKEQLEFQRLIGQISETEEVTEEDLLKARATQLLDKYGYDSLEGIKNLIADGISLVVFGLLVYYGRTEIEVLKSFLDKLVYGLSDSAKAFIIILFTDVFVGYHSPHGWEVFLAGVCRHFGIPENHDAIFTFIATFPVFLDTLIKYWIFRYLNRVSPSAVATYRTMND